MVGGEVPHTLIAMPGTQIKDHNFHQGNKRWNRCPGRLCNLHPWRHRLHRPCTKWRSLEQGVGLDDSRGPVQPKPFCNSVTVLFLTLLRLRLCFNIGSKALTKARCIISAITSAVNPCIIHQLSTLPLATLHPALCESPPPAGGCQTEALHASALPSSGPAHLSTPIPRISALLITPVPLHIQWHHALPDQSPDLLLCSLRWQGSERPMLCPGLAPLPQATTNRPPTPSHHHRPFSWQGVFSQGASQLTIPAASARERWKAGPRPAKGYSSPCAAPQPRMCWNPSQSHTFRNPKLWLIDLTRTWVITRVIQRQWKIVAQFRAGELVKLSK